MGGKRTRPMYAAHAMAWTRSWSNECLSLIDYYCEHDEEREAIAMAGREKVLAEHTYDQRLDRIFAMCRKEWGI